MLNLSVVFPWGPVDSASPRPTPRIASSTISVVGSRAQFESLLTCVLAGYESKDPLWMLPLNPFPGARESASSTGVEVVGLGDERWAARVPGATSTSDMLARIQAEQVLLVACAQDRLTSFDQAASAQETPWWRFARLRPGEEVLRAVLTTLPLPIFNLSATRQGIEVYCEFHEIVTVMQRLEGLAANMASST